MRFLDNNYLLTNDSAIKIFTQIKDLPIIDAHNHADASEIANNNNYQDIWQVMAATDHYVWEMMRKRGVKERFITGEASNKEKWIKLAGICEELVGNPIYEWLHLDFKQRLGINQLINKESAEEIWKIGNEVLAKKEKRPQQLLEEMNIESFCTTNDPLELLEDHKRVADLKGKGYMRPTWRPDRAINILKDDWLNYVKRLENRVNISILNLDDFIKALQITHDYFSKFGCLSTDHGLQVPFGYLVEKKDVEKVFQKRINDENISMEEATIFMSFMLHEFGKMNVKKGWVMQIHIGAVRDIRTSLLKQIGADSGGDVSSHMIEIINPLKDFLNEFDENNQNIQEELRGLKVVLYCLDPHHQSTLATLTRTFGKNVNLGAAWWFNDSPIGIKKQLEYICSVDVLMNFAGMVTDSRKVMSYGSRTEMFRRILSDVLGKMVENGQIPLDLAIKTAKYVCYEGPKKFFGF